MELSGTRFQLKHQIGKGRWSVVYKGLDTVNDANVAIKLEEIHELELPLLYREAKIMKHLRNVIGIPTLIESGCTSTHNYIALELLDASLYELHQAKKLSSISVLHRAEQLLSTLEGIHSKNILHRDLKPKNLMAKAAATYLIDFGLASVKKQAIKRAPSPDRVIGTPSFASLSALLGLDQFPRDDLESMGYVIIWLLKGSLPWESYVLDSNLSGLKMMKFHSTVRMICNGCPEEMTQYFNYVKALRETEVPNYSFLRSLMVSASNRLTSGESPTVSLTTKYPPKIQVKSVSARALNRRPTKDGESRYLLDSSRNDKTNARFEEHQKDNSPALISIKKRKKISSARPAEHSPIDNFTLSSRAVSLCKNHGFTTAVADYEVPILQDSIPGLETSLDRTHQGQLRTNKSEQSLSKF